jgi:hypothetical protein
MSTDVAGVAASASAPPKWMLWTGRVMTVLPCLLFLFSASGKVMQQPQVMEAMGGKYGYPAGSVMPIGVIEVLCTVLYAIPQTSVLGAALLTGYLGGAVSTHVRAGESWLMTVVVGVFVWGGIFLRDPRLHALMPLRRP